MNIECPYCHEEIRISKDMALYDWDDDFGVRIMNCPSCQSRIEIEVTAGITSIEVIGCGESAQLAQEAYWQYQEMKYDAAKEELLD